MQTRGSAGALRKALFDRNALVRYSALKALLNFDPGIWQNAAASLLKDPVRAVRIAAADLFHRIPPGMMVQGAKNNFPSADAENRSFLNYQADFSTGNICLQTMICKTMTM
jgi:hypothetical protein